METTLQVPTRIPWWKGTRGEWYVVGQAILGVLVIFGPRTYPGWTVWVYPYAEISLVLGAILILTGVLLFVAGTRELGSNLTAVPCPKEEAQLVESGPYALVRHPMYSGAAIAALGWALCVQGWLTIGYAMVLFFFFDFKSRREEQWLVEKFSGYESYRTRIRKLIPFIY